MPTLYWGPWLAKIRRGGPAYTYISGIIVTLTGGNSFCSCKNPIKNLTIGLWGVRFCLT